MKYLTVLSYLKNVVTVKRKIPSLSGVMAVGLVAAFFASSILSIVNAAPPDVLTITPDVGSVNGGTAVTIGGTNFEHPFDPSLLISSEADNDATSVTTDPDGNFYATGAFWESLTIQGTTVTGHASDYNAFIAKFDSSGTLLWLRAGGGTAGDDYGKTIGIDPAGDVIVAGNGNGTMTFGTLSGVGSTYNNAFIVKYDSDGNEIWLTVEQGSESEVVNDMDIDSSGNIYITGRYDGTTTFGGVVVPNANTDFSQDVYIAKYDINGDFVFVRHGGGTLSEVGYSIAVDSSSNIYVTGLAESATVTFGALSDTNNDGQRQAFLLKYDSTGTEEWFKMTDQLTVEVNGVYGTGVAVDSTDMLYLGVSPMGQATFGDSTFGAAGVTRSALIKYNSAGVEQWVKEGTSPSHVFAEQIAIGRDGALYQTGYFETSYTVQGETITGDIGSFITKYDLSGNLLEIDGGSSTSDIYTKEVAVDAEGNAYTVGIYWDDLTFGSFTSNTPGGFGLFITQFSNIEPEVTIGGNACTDLVYVSDTSLTCTTAAHAAGEVDVVVTNASTETDTLVGGFEYTEDAPAPTATPTPTPGATATPTPTPTPSPAPAPEVVPVTAGAAHPNQPADGEVASETPAFSWQAPAEPENVAKYILVIDGVQVFEFDAGKSVETDKYILVYDSSNQSYLLQVKEPIESGEHTWWIISRSTTGKDTESEHWTFIVGGTSGDGSGDSEDGSGVGGTSSPTPTPSPSSLDDEASESATATGSGETETSTGSGLLNDLPDLSGVGSAIGSGLGGAIASLGGGIGEGIQTAVESVTETILVLRENETVVEVAETTPPVIVLAAPVLTAVAAATQVGWSFFTFKNFVKIAKSMKYLAGGSLLGYTYDHNTLAPISFALLTLRNADGSVQQSRITNVVGRYHGFNPPPGTYVLTATHNIFDFARDKSQQVLGKFVYDGQPVTFLTAKQTHQFLVPMQAKQQVGVMGMISGAIIGLLKFNHHYHVPVSIGLFLFSVFMTLIAPNPLNVVLTGISTFFMLRNIVRGLKRPVVKGTIVDAKQHPVANSLVAAVDVKTGELTNVTTSDRNGKFAVKDLHGVNKMVPIKPGFAPNERPVLADLEHHKSENVRLVMASAA